MKSLSISIIVLLLIACNSERQSTSSKTDNRTNLLCDTALILKQDTSNTFTQLDHQHDSLNTPDVVPKESIPLIGQDKRRAQIDSLLTEKEKRGQKRIVHVLVPLCDNVHQGIVPVNDRLGDGFNLRTNLYWGAGYGIATFFKRSNNWKLLLSQDSVSEGILQRLIFQHKDSTDVFLVADAYAGDRMEDCLIDYLLFLGGRDTIHIKTAQGVINAGGGADMIVFNGHNGFMDGYDDFELYKSPKPKDAVMIACASYDYLSYYIKGMNVYPYFTTTNLLAPEAYVLDAVLTQWVKGNSGEVVRKAGGRAYQSKHNCSVKAATNLFAAGWRE